MIKIYHDYNRRGYFLVKYQDTSRGREFYNGMDWKVTREGEALSPDDYWCFIPEDDMPDIIKELNSIGVKAVPEAKVEGILEATKYHLEDMRKLVLGKK